MSTQVGSILDNIIDKGSHLTEQAIHKAQELGNIVQDHIEDISDKVNSNEHVKDAIDKANVIKENINDKMHEVADNAMKNEHVANAVHKADEIKGDAVEKFQEASDNAMKNEHVANAMHKAEELKDNMASKMSDAKDSVEAKFNDSEYTPETIDIDAANAILGKTVGDVTILNSNEEVLAFPGEVVTQELIESARTHKVLDVLMNNVA